MSAAQEIQVHVGRRAVVAAGATGLAVVLTACGGGSKDSGGSDTVEPAGEGNGGKGGAPLAATADIPEGGGVVFADQGVVVTQPQAGEFRAFSSECTHQGCAVKGVAEGVITCPCHNSMFDAATGEVRGGPATTPLPEKQIRVEGGSITLA
ncbi:Rieske (2Fe-2S) protein [Streptomyces sp. NE06-03E]|uniref:Cytochrome bc1 complex Rieske iron-sulfur subunit n=2 Tax=Streptomyces TaxID=1883 RepID=A0A652KP72_9ACTN|nr:MULTISPECIES: Rieske (2Fe-2S) protein [unclassified Streptomyces]MDX3057966.1 Rieske (2Fe-2S) protein [Streptomyces sp. NE06-03E]MDX3327419.1 Rieske (2Fe-2S) protein [Streptomyces sp. ME02-6979-3A]MDX3432455.1 Rieske (2Fe-2S) protein [Streptomyces sp. ME01-18a]TXS25451.1 Rieske (2Fe-2S) protein [Streptomyces sp. gb1(2016)]